MVKIIWSTQAISDLEEIADFISKDSVQYARITVDKIYQRIGAVAQHPYSGRIIPEKNLENFREVIEGNYRIMYEVISEDELLILAVYHSARFFG